MAQTPTGKYFVSILVEENEQLFPKIDTKVGIDVGLKDFAILSNGKKYENPKWLRKAERRLALLQRSLSRKRKVQTIETRPGYKLQDFMRRLRINAMIFFTR